MAESAPLAVKFLADKGAKIDVWNSATSSVGRRRRSPEATDSATSSHRR
jgi:hypothetical protein